MTDNNPERDPSLYDPAPPTPETIADFLKVIDDKLQLMPPPQLADFPGTLNGEPVRFVVRQTPPEYVKQYSGIAGVSVRPANADGSSKQNSRLEAIEYVVIPPEDDEGELTMRKLLPIDPMLATRAAEDVGLEADARELFARRDELEAEARTAEHELGLDAVSDQEVRNVIDAITDTLGTGDPDTAPPFS